MEPWIGVDLDGTLAHYDEWRGTDYIGEPIELMLERVYKWLEEGKKVKIVTARIDFKPVREWLDSLGLDVIEITNKKDFGMLELWDDRCIQVIPNTGVRIDGGL